MKAEKDARGKDLPASEIAALSELPVAEKQVDSVVEAFTRLGMGGMSGKAAAGVTGALGLQDTDAAEFNAAVALAMQAAGKMFAAQPGKAAYSEEDLAPYLCMSYAPEPDLFIRTGGEQRISNFLLWQLAYTELYFTDTFWPDFDATALDLAISSYRQRERRFGRTSEQLLST